MHMISLSVTGLMTPWKILLRSKRQVLYTIKQTKTDVSLNLTAALLDQLDKGRITAS